MKNQSLETSKTNTYRCFDPISHELVYEISIGENGENADFIEMLRADDENVRKQNNWFKNHTTSHAKPFDPETGEAISDDQNLAFLDWTYSPEFVLFASDEPESFDAQTMDRLYVLRIAVKQLTIHQQNLIYQFFSKQLTLTQIAHQENTTPQAIYNRFAKIKTRLRKLMEEAGVRGDDMEGV